MKKILFFTLNPLGACDWQESWNNPKRFLLRLVHCFRIYKVVSEITNIAVAKQKILGYNLKNDYLCKN